MSFHLKHLKEYLAKFPQANYPFHSRIHPLRSFPSPTCYIKRDDELGFGISGSKIRKYRTLIPFFIQQGFQEVIIIGSAYSNHVLSIVQLLIENGIRPTLFLRGDPERLLQGNALLTSLFISPTAIHWFSKSEWHSVESKAQIYARQQPHATFVLPEGGFIAEALPGALTLPLDIVENENEMEIQFDHIFIEAGTGFTASALILGLHWLEHPAKVHVVLLAEDEDTFLSRLTQCQVMFNQWMHESSSFPHNFVLHMPQLTGKFGQVNTLIFESIAHCAQQEGFLTDPIYTAKLMIESRHLLQQGNIQGHVLIHHSGGALTLMGFQDRFLNFY